MILAYGFRLQILMKLFNFESLTLCQALFFFVPTEPQASPPWGFFLEQSPGQSPAVRGNLWAYAQAISWTISGAISGLLAGAISGF